MNNRMKLLRRYYDLLGFGQGGPIEPFSYIVNNDLGTTAMTLEYLGNNTSVVIPSNIEGYDITEIGPFTFVNSQNITSSRIPDSAIKID